MKTIDKETNQKRRGLAPGHTPGMARITGANDDPHGDYYIRVTSPDGTDTPIAVTRHGEERANAEHLVRCWNCHDQLVEALQLATALLATYTGNGATLNDGKLLDHISQNPETVVDFARSALEKAGVRI